MWIKIFECEIIILYSIAHLFQQQYIAHGLFIQHRDGGEIIIKLVEIMVKAHWDYGTAHWDCCKACWD